MTRTRAPIDRGVTADALQIMVVDDHRAFGDLLSYALSMQPGMACVGTASSAAEGVAMAADLRPDVAVMDIEMPRQDGLAATPRIRDVAPDTAVVVISAHRDPQWVVRAAQAGASAFVPKDASLDEILDVLRRVRAGSMLVAPSAFAGGTSSAPVAGDTGPAPALTQREREVLACLGRGLPPKAIARVLGISVHTCRGYVKSLHAKLGVRSQLEAVVKAQHLGLIDTVDA
jgi:DNA-binding NarL/FixJ family response regulator